MIPLAIVGPSDTGKTTLVETLVDRLSERGQVGTVKHIDCDPDLDTEGKDTRRHRSAGAVQTYGIADGGWFATGESLSLSDAFDRLADSCDYVLVEGYRGSNLPKVVLDKTGRADSEAATADNVLVRAESTEEVNVQTVIECLDTVESFETRSSLVARVKSRDNDRGGTVATFSGRVRTGAYENDDTAEGRTFGTDGGVAADELTTIREKLDAEDGVSEVFLHHRSSGIEDRRGVVHLVVLADDRRVAIRTIEDGIDRLTEHVPLFEKELTVSDGC